MTDRMTGFTLVLDGDPDAVESVWKAVETAMGALYREAAAKMEREWISAIGVQTTIPAPVLPVRGEFTIRPAPTPADDAEQRLRPSPRLS